MADGLASLVVDKVDFCQSHQQGRSVVHFEVGLSLLPITCSGGMHSSLKTRMESMPHRTQ
ncbi:hypothetical protein [Sinorhizobium meliloti]|uniref:hypothetical protein n=1 Tax=Rhizobium meliloti TaxID=382 RepID=UPI0013E288ED|nr:hypothetical protein [Sinorhizobium meliloti]QND30426.1 hypothetical protein HB773_30930 [Sinorhizobium meliloti]